jgi:hypothetical protein
LAGFILVPDARLGGGASDGSPYTAGDDDFDDLADSTAGVLSGFEGNDSGQGANKVQSALAAGVFSDLAALFAPTGAGSGPTGTSKPKSGRGVSTQRGGGRASITSAVQAKMQLQEQHNKKEGKRQSVFASSGSLHGSAGESFSENSSQVTDEDDDDSKDVRDEDLGTESDQSDSWITVGSASSLSDYSESEEAGLFTKLDQKKAGNVWITLSRFSSVPFEAVEEALSTLLTARDVDKAQEVTPPLRHPLLTEDSLRALLALKPADEERKAFREWLPSVLALSDLAAERLAKRNARRAEQKKRWQAREEAAQRRVEKATAKAQRQAARKARRAKQLGTGDDNGDAAAAASSEGGERLSARVPRNPTRTFDGKRRRRVDSVEQELLLMKEEEEADMDRYAQVIGGEAEVMLLRRPIPGLTQKALQAAGTDLAKLPRQTIVTLANRLAPPDAFIFRACASTRYIQRSDCLRAMLSPRKLSSKPPLVKSFGSPKPISRSSRSSWW